MVQASTIKHFQSFTSGEADDIRFSAAMHALWNADVKLNKNYDLETETGRILYAAYLQIYAVRYPGLAIFEHGEKYSAFRKAVGQDVLLRIAGVEVWMPALLAAPWLYRDDLNTHIEVTTEDGVSTLCGVLLSEEFVEYPEAIWLLKPFFVQIVPGVLLPRYAHACWCVRRDLQIAFDLEVEDGVAGLCGNLLAADPFFLELTPWLESYFSEILSSVEVPRYAYCVWLDRPDLVNAFDLETFEGRSGLCGNLLADDPFFTKLLPWLEPYFSEILPVVDVPRYAYCVWLNRHEPLNLVDAFDLETLEGRSGLCGNLLADDPFFTKLLPWLESYFSEILPAVEVPRYAYCIWLDRPDLVNAFDLDTLEGRSGLCGNLLADDPFFSKLLPWLEPYFSEILSPVGVPRYAYCIWLDRPDLMTSFDLETFEGQSGLCGNLLATDPFFLKLFPWLEPYFAEILPAVEVPRYAYCIWLTRVDLVAAFDLDTLEGRVGLCGNLLNESEYFQRLRPLIRSFLSAPVYPWNISLHAYAIWLANGHFQSEFPLEDEKKRAQYCVFCREHFLVVDCDLPPKISERTHALKVEGKYGVNLVGYPRSVSGIGEDLRMVARAFDVAEIPYCVVETPCETPSLIMENVFEDKLVTQARYPITLVCLPASDIVRLFSSLGENLFAGKYVIGQMPWELADWPEPMLSMLDLLDEGWALSQFNHSALEPVFDKPLSIMLRPVELGPVSPKGRADFGIPAEPYAYFFIYDGLSTSTRKNPDAVLNAFARAFPRGDEDVCLVLKTMNSSYDPFYEKIREYARKDPRVHLINEVMERSDLLAMYSCCDAYISLHRSEGFGLPLAEAMLFGKPVITSDYSGNCDFCTDETSFLVRGDLIPVKKGEYFFTEEQVWFDADVGHAAEMMRHCFLHPDEAEAKGAAGRRLIESEYSFDTLSKKYQARLEFLFRELNKT